MSSSADGSIEPQPEVGAVPAYIGGFDGLRGVAAALIVVAHSGVYFVPKDVWWQEGAMIVLEVFFVLSAFLGVSSLLREHKKTGKIRVFRFYRHRLGRLVPVVAAYVVFQIVYSIVTNQFNDVEWWSLLKLALGVLNFYQFTPGLPADGFGHLWYVSVEVQLTIVLPILVLALVQFRRHWTPLIVLVVAVVAANFWRYHLYQISKSNFILVLLIWTRSDLHIGMILMGVLLGFWWRDHRVSPRLASWLGWLGLICVVYAEATVTRFTAMGYNWFFGLVEVSIVLILVAMMMRKGPSFIFETKVLRALGQASYSIYVWHLGVIVVLRRVWLHGPTLAKFALVFAGTAVTSTLSWYFLERNVTTKRARRGQLANHHTSPAPLPASS